ncbi:ArsR/SmtB family transcription factor [Paenibacillus alvei]|uniref:ArsR/SmtB family transcription factor n=1 Tax=Paenibacillus alvei TaxID=44250 RepID=UPI0018CEDEAB|nr:winged helix-turn-helix domain-containing protein [Paenibacillus alvei]MBG9737549.1 transcriptional regulator [Paenibacillus alvei]MBG9747240.1 transcriptional regulator [Paenibacillus alvei]MCY9581279.1 winged helix-turn-helix domain-containing protein [Paenibacillus alvei]MCY9584431.1 winged helix-turn-helix domain-containing protein [Paenibacillus alvei]
MNVNSVYKIQTHEQLKAIADPLRTKMLMNLVKQEYTGQQLAEMLGITRNNIYFHLKELVKHQVIQVVRKEEKNGIVQKYYRAVASRFIPEDHLLPSMDLIDTSRQVFMETVEVTRTKIESAPAASFALNSSNLEQRKNIASTYQMMATEGNFHAFIEEFKLLLDKHFTQHTGNEGQNHSKNECKQHALQTEKTEEQKSYYLSLIAFQDDSEDIAIP